MGDASSTFEIQFHKLQGDTVSQRKKNFFKFLRQPDFLINKESVQSTLNNLQPRDYAESYFKLEAMLYFKMTDALLDIVQDGINESFICHIIKHKWFLEKVFQSYDVEKFVNIFLRQTSYTIRMKLLGKITQIWDEQKFDELYDHILKRYGLFVARTVLDKCTMEKLRTELEDKEITLTANQVINLYCRDVELFKMYLVYYKGLDFGVYDEEKVLKRVALKTPDLLMDLRQKKLIRYKMGKRTSKKVFHLIKDDSDNIEQHMQFMNKSVLIRKLGNKFEDIYKKLFPNQIESINSYSWNINLLKYYPKNKRWPVFYKVCTQNFGEDNMPKVYRQMSDTLLKLCHPNRDVFQLWAAINYESSPQDSCEYLKYYETSKAIVILKEKIKVTSDISRRANLLYLMVQACAENNDLNALEDVLNYICAQHRNEEYYTRQSILREIKNNFKIEHFRQSHWKYLNEQIKILRLQKRYDADCKYLTEYYIQFLILNNKSFEDVLLQYVKDVLYYKENFMVYLEKADIITKFYTETINIFPKALVEKNNSETDQFFVDLIQNAVEFENKDSNILIHLENLKSVEDFFVQISTTPSADRVRTDCKFIRCLILHNLLHPSSNSYFDQGKVLKMLSKLASENSNVFRVEIFEMAIMKENRNSFEEGILKIYFEHVFQRFNAADILTWFLRRNPSALLPYATKIIKELSYIDIKRRSLIALKYYPHLGLYQKCCELYKNILINLDESTEEQIVLAMKLLSTLLTTSEFIELVETYFLPQKTKLDLEDEKMAEFYKTQCDIIKNLHKVEEPSKLLPVILKFCVGDYTKSALTPLYSIFYRSPEQQLHHYISELSKRAVSVKKHSLFLGCRLLDFNTVLKMLKEANKTANVSSQKHVFSSILRYFLRNPSQEMFHLVVNNLNTIDKNDTEMLEYLKNATIPKKYRALYLEKCWEFFENLEQQGISIVAYLDTLLLSIIDVEVVKNLSPEFIKKLLNKYFKNHEQPLNNIEQFVCYSLRYRISERMDNLVVVFEILKSFKKDQIYKFFAEFAALNIESTDNEFLELFAHIWRKNFNMNKTFKEIVGLQLLQFHHLSENTAKYAQNIVTYMENLTAEYGHYTVILYSKVLEEHLGKLNKEIVLQLHLNILEYKNTLDTCILVLTLLDNNVDDKYSEIHNQIKNILSNSPVGLVGIYYQQFKEF